MKPLYLFGVALLVLWGQLFLHLSLEWSYNQQYSYGWLVPVLGGYLLYTRWRESPAFSDPAAPVASRFVLFGAVLLVLPLRILEEANPDWRLLSWIHAGVALTATICVVNLVGGRKWIHWFGWVFAFLLVAVPWPTSVENGVVQGLMRLVSVVTAELANWAGVPAVPRGNLIELPTGTLGVSEACSGVRSLQASVMCCAFFSLLYGIPLKRAWPIWLIGISAAVFLNICRTFFLAMTAANRGIHAVELVHDPAGHLLVVAVFLVCWFAASRITNQALRPDGRSWGQATVLSLVNSAGLPLFLSAWILFTAAASELWFLSAPNPGPVTPPWNLQLPADAGPSKPIPPSARAILRCDASSSNQFTAPDGARWNIFSLTWNPGSAVAQLARSHSPEICLPAAGIMLREKTSPYDLDLGDGRGALRFDRYVFEQRGRPIYVFFAVWEPGSEAAANGEFDPAAMYSRRNRLRAALERRRLLGQQVIEIAIEGVPTLEAATESVQQFLPRWLPPK